MDVTGVVSIAVALLTLFGTLILAVVTLGVAAATFMTALQTRDLAKYTKDLGTQAQQQVREMETSRKLEWAPYLTFQHGVQEPAGGVVHYSAEVVNIGRGPAINCLVARRISNDQWCLSGNLDVGGGQSSPGSVLAPAQIDAMPDFLVQGGNGRTVLLCQDQFGACHLFDPPRAPQTSPSPADQTAWAVWYRAQIHGV